MLRIILHNGKILRRCVYCAAAAESRDHVIARCFNKRIPGARIPIVPACRRCNQMFGSQENALYHQLKDTRLIQKIFMSDDDNLSAEDVSFLRVLQSRASAIAKKIACGLVAYRWGQTRPMKQFGPVQIGTEVSYYNALWWASVEGSWPIRDLFAPDAARYAFVRISGRIQVLAELGVLHVAIECPEFDTDGVL